MSKSRPNGKVLAFFHRLAPEDASLSVLTLGELRKGVASRAKRDRAAANVLALWIDRLEGEYKDRILPIDQPIARIWGELSAHRSRPFVDTLLAATAMHHRLTLVTRNVRDVQDMPVTLHNPWLP